MFFLFFVFLDITSMNEIREGICWEAWMDAWRSFVLRRNEVGWIPWVGA